MEERFMEQLKEIFDLDNKEILLDDKFRDYEKWDSLTNLSLLAMLDSEYGVMIGSKDFNGLKTVGDLLSEVTKRMK